MTYYARHLPHWQPPGRPIFLTWRLFGSLPEKVIAELQRHRNSSEGKTFLMADRELDSARTGPRWLKDVSIARCVIAALYRGEHELHHYMLRAFAIMPNHVHVLIEPSVSLARITNGLKRVTARQANQLLGQTGRHFWQGESFDHWIRNGAEYDRVTRYIEQNPVAAGLVKNPEDWP